MYYRMVEKTTSLLQNMVQASLRPGDNRLSTRAETMMDGLEEVRVVIGSQEHSGITDRDIQDTLHYYQYDVQQSVNWLLGIRQPYGIYPVLTGATEEQQRKQVAKERKGGFLFKVVFAFCYFPPYNLSFRTPFL